MSDINPPEILDEHNPPPPPKPGEGITGEFWGHPRGLFYLFFAELWERFSFYGMRALLTLYMINDFFAHLANGETLSYGVYASYGTLVYLTPVIGGAIADRLIGYRRSIMLGAALMAAGHFVLTLADVSDAAFYGALSLLIIGNGFFKPNISSFVGRLYKDGDNRKDSGFTIFYMGINIGAAVAPFLCGWLGQTYGWHYGFGLAGIGMLIGLVAFWQGIMSNTFGPHGKPPKPAAIEVRKFGLKVKHWVPVIAILLVPVVSVMIYRGELGGVSLNGEPVDFLQYSLFAIILGVLVYTLINVTSKERQMLLVAIFFTLFITVFWTFFELSGSVITVFAERAVNLVVLNASQTNLINPTFIILLSIPFSIMWVRLEKRKLNPRSPYKFALGLALLAVGFWIFAISYNAGSEFTRVVDGNEKTVFLVPVFYLYLGYFFISSGELCVSPVGLSKITSLSPAKITGFMMGVWFLSSSFAFFLGELVGEATALDQEKLATLPPQQIVANYTDVFQDVAIIAIASAGVALLLSPLLRRWSHEVH